jgi:hypothetical protein
LILEGLDHSTIYNITVDEIKNISAAAIYAVVGLLSFNIATRMQES